MKLRPVRTTPRPSYPEGPPWRRGLLRGLRRVTAAGALAGSLWLGGCYGATRLADDSPLDADVVDAAGDALDGGGDALADADEGGVEVDGSIDGDTEASVDAEVVVDAEVTPPGPQPCEPEPRLSGEVAPPQYFVCSYDEPPLPLTALPIYLGDGQLCPDGAAFSWFSLEERARVRVGLLDYSEAVLLTVMNAEGQVLAQVGPGNACLELEVEPEALRLVAEPASPTAPAEAYFEFYVDFADEAEPHSGS